MVRGLHNAVERIRANYEVVDKLIASVKASEVKNKDRRAVFNQPINSYSMGKLANGSRILCQKVSASS